MIGAARRLQRDGAQGVVVIGSSMGGAPALVGAAKLYPRLARGAVTLGAVPAWIRDDGLAAVRHSRLPLQLTASQHDPLGLTPDVRKLYRASASRDKRQLLIPGSGHGIETLASRKLVAAIYAFLRSELR